MNAPSALPTMKTRQRILPLAILVLLPAAAWNQEPEA